MIKNGSYYKLMKAYYSDSSTSSTVSSLVNSSSSTSTSSDSTKTLTAIEESADALKESADTLLTTGTKSVFNKVSVTTEDENGNSTTTKEYDTDAIYDAVSSFVESYNSLISSAGDSSTTSIQNKLSSLVNVTKSNQSLLSSVGITINSDNTLSIDEDTFKSSDMTTVKSLFNGSGSYAYNASAYASLIDYAASTESSKSSTYTALGTYSSTYSSGSILDYLY